MTFDVFLTMIYLQHIYIYFNILPFPFLLSMCHQRPFLHYYFIDLTEYYLLTFTSISSLDLMICQGSSYFDLHLPFLLRSYFPNSGIFFQKFNFWVFSQSIKRAIYNRTNNQTFWFCKMGKSSGYSKGFNRIGENRVNELFYKWTI